MIPMLIRWKCPDVQIGYPAVSRDDLPGTPVNVKAARQADAHPTAVDDDRALSVDQVAGGFAADIGQLRDAQRKAIIF